MQIFKTDNFDRENRSEVVIAKDIPTQEYADTIAAALNHKYSGPASSDYFIVKDNNAKPFIFEP